MADETAPSPGKPQRPLGDDHIVEDILELPLHAKRILWSFVPDSSIARKVAFQQFMASTFLSDGAREAVRYGALVSIAGSGGSPLRSALLGAIGLVPPTLLGIVGGTIADALPRRSTLGIIYVLQALSCALIPLMLGTGFWDVAILIFTINLLGQVSGPTEQSIAPLVASEEQLGSANSLLSLCSNAGAAVGTAVLAPIIVISWGTKPLFLICGLMLFLAANRVFRTPGRGDAKRVPWQRREREPRGALRWLIGEPAVASMLSFGILAGVANVVLTSLAPQYVVDVLQVNATSTVYVFAPSTAGVILALVLAPKAMRLLGERRCAAVALLITASTLVALGLVRDSFAVLVDPFNPLRLLGVAGVDLSPKLRTAGLLAMPLGFGVSLTATAVQTYINRRVPLRLQGRAFALQSTLKNGAAIIPLLSLGAIASVVGVSIVLVVSPLVLIAVGIALLRLSEHYGAHIPGSRLDVLESYWHQPEEAPLDRQPPTPPPPTKS